MLFTLATMAQVGLSTTPAVPTSSDNIILQFNKTETPLEATASIYAHIGVTVNGARWQKVIANWAVNVEKNTFTNTEGNLYQLDLGNLYEYFDVPTTSTISEICLVVRNATGTIKSEGNDVFIPIYEPGLHTVLTSPKTGGVFLQGTDITITGDASVDSFMALYVNDVLVKSENGVKTISHTHTIAQSGEITLKVFASLGEGNDKTNEIKIYVPELTQEETRPANLKHGVNKMPNGDVTFMLFAPNKVGVMLVGDFNDWTFSPTYQMKRDGDYYWLTIPAANLAPNTEYAYQYAIDFNNRVADGYTEKTLDPDMDKYITNAVYPNLKKYPTGKTTGICSLFQINEQQYEWKVPNFQRPDKTNVVFYEMHIRDFTAQGTFDAAIQKLDILKELGVTGIELMPVNEFEGNDSWGYNPSFYFALDKAYGPKNKFKEFVDACHTKGMTVILDVVFNHTFSQSPFLRMYEYNSNNGGTTVGNPYYAPKHNFNEPGMRYGYKLNHESPHTQRWIKDVMSYWINEYKVDGFRLDLSKGFTNKEYAVGDWGSAYNQERIDRLTDYANYVFTNHGNDIAFTIEHLADNPEEIVLANNGLMPWGNMSYNYAQGAMGNHESGKSNLGKAYYKTRGWSKKNLVSYMESHDEERMMYWLLKEGKTSTDLTYSTKEFNTAVQRVQLASCFFLTVPGPKMIWQFGELGYDYGINYCPDGSYKNDCRTGRKPVKWEYYQDEARKSIFNTYAKLNALKQTYPKTFNTDFAALAVSSNLKRILLYEREDKSAEGLNAVVLGNFDVVAAEINPNFPHAGTWYDFFTGQEIEVTELTAKLNFAPGEYRLYLNKTEPLLLSTNEVTGINNKTSLSIYPNPAYSVLNFSQEILKAEVLDITGKTLGTYTGSAIANNAISIEGLAQGIYLVKVTNTNNQIVTLRFIKE